MLKKTKLQDIVRQLKEATKKFNYSLEAVTSKTKERKKKVVTKSFHKAGIVVPLDGNDVGYRPLTLTDSKSILFNYLDVTLEIIRKENLLLGSS